MSRAAKRNVLCSQTRPVVREDDGYPYEACRPFLTLGLERNSFCASSLWYTHDSCGWSFRSPTYAHVLDPFLHVFTCATRG